LLLHPHKHINPNAAKRLQAIETFSEMGAGFAIAMRDLEIRGAGNLLGIEQSGHIATVGYELYCQMLEASVRRLKQLPQKFSVHVDLDLPGVAYLPDDYIADRRQKIDFYRRLTRVEQFSEIEALRTELVDRFGQPPQPVEKLLELANIKLEAAVWQIQSIYLQDQYIGFRFGDRRRIEQLSSYRSGKLRIVDQETAIATLKTPKPDSNRLLAIIKAILQCQ
jgi:transcription-repair coupling factor (superfamily II helicase)